MALWAGSSRFQSQRYEVKNKIQEVQLKNFCCGVDNFRDYGDLANFPGDKLPKGVYWIVLLELFVQSVCLLFVL